MFGQGPTPLFGQVFFQLPTRLVYSYITKKPLCFYPKTIQGCILLFILFILPKYFNIETILMQSDVKIRPARIVWNIDRRICLFTYLKTVSNLENKKVELEPNCCQINLLDNCRSASLCVFVCVTDLKIATTRPVVFIVCLILGRYLMTQDVPK